MDERSQRAFVELLKKHLRQEGNEILVVGSKPTNLSRKIRENPKLVFWDSTDQDTWHKDSIPIRVSLVFFFRWISHQLQDKVCAMAHAQGVTFDKEVKSAREVKQAFMEIEQEETVNTITATSKATSKESFQRAVQHGIAAVPAEPVSAGELVPGKDDVAISQTPSDADEILGRLMSDEDLSQLAMEQFLENFRKAKEDLRRAEEEIAKLLGLKAKNEELERKIEELRKYREFVVTLTRLIESTKAAEHA